MTEHTAKINAETNLYGIFGNPVGHSLSPTIHNALFERFRLNSVYLAFPIIPDGLGLAFEAIRSLGIRGVNITVPFKEEAIEFIDEIPEDIDRCVGALNTVVNKNGKLFGYNTDGPGFLTALADDLKFNPAGKTALVLGAGGAARGVVFALAQAHTERILICNRTQERAIGLMEYVEKHFPSLDVDVVETPEEAANEKINLVVNATTSGMGKDHSVPMDLKVLNGKPTVYDLVYSPAETPFLKAAKKLELPHANGLGMLAAQAALSFELWTGHKEGVREAMLEVLKSCRL